MFCAIQRQRPGERPPGRAAALSPRQCNMREDTAQDCWVTTCVWRVVMGDDRRSAKSIGGTQQGGVAAICLCRRVGVAWVYALENARGEFEEN